VAHFTGMKRRSNRFLMWALAISLATHAVFIYWAQDMHGSSAEPAAPPDIIRLDPLRKPPPPEPIVTPKPVVPVKPAVAARTSRPVLTRVHDNANTDTVEPPVGPVGPVGPINPNGPDVGTTGSPSPTGSPAPSCTAPDVAARALTTVTPDTPAMAQEQGLTGTTQVQVSLDPSGSVTDVRVYRSSGSQLLDNAALGAARQSTYRPDVRNCEAIAGDYLFTVTFQ
jgi:protein TonB